MTARPRNRLAVDERRAQLIALGRRLFAERPYDEISIDDIAEAGAVSKGLLYHYFQSKRRFYVETVRASFAEMTERTEPDRTLPPLEQLDASLDAYLEYVADNGAEYRNMLRSGIGADPEVAEIIESQRQVVIERVLSALGLEEPRPGIRLALRAWLGFMDAASIDWLEHGDVPRDTVRAMLASSLQSALLTAAQADPELKIEVPEGEDGSPTLTATRIALAIAGANTPAED